MAASRHSLVSSALRLSYFTVGWNGIVGATALAVGLVSGSLALAGFALNALLDSSASVVLVWRFHRERSDPAGAEHLERRAHAFIVGAMLLVAGYVGIESVQALVDASHADELSDWPGNRGGVVACVPWLGRAKLRVQLVFEPGSSWRRRADDRCRGTRGDHAYRVARQLGARLVVGRSRRGAVNRGGVGGRGDTSRCPP